MPTPSLAKSEIVKPASLPHQDKLKDPQLERPIPHPYWLNMAMGSTLQYALEREAEWARG